MTQLHSHFTVDQFCPTSLAKKMRGHFDKMYEDPRISKPTRFIWDYWYVENQYRLMRTPLNQFLPGPDYSAFVKHLLGWGARNLGCQGVSPLWLSYYVDGSYQRIHGDNPHGPWAFVYSLTDWTHKKFSGGETVLLKPEILSFWKSFNPAAGLENQDAYLKIPPQFNRLTLFDPRIPHFVEEVKGVQDPREGRLVIHGWFTQPSPSVEGGLSHRLQSKFWNTLYEEVASHVPSDEFFDGMLNLSISVTPAGKVSQVKPLQCAVISRLTGEPLSEELLGTVLFSVKNHVFPKAKVGSRIVLPLFFRE